MYKPLCLIVVIVTALSFSSVAQLEKGKQLLNGSLNFHTKNEDVNSSVSNNPSKSVATHFSLNANYGFFNKVGLVLGISGGIGNGRTKSEETLNNQSLGKTRNSSWGAGPFLRWYKPLGSNFHFFLHSKVSYGRSKLIVESSFLEDSRREEQGGNVGVSLTPGISYFLGKRFAVELSGFNVAGSISKLESKTFKSGNETESRKSTVGCVDFNPFSTALQDLNFGVNFFF